MASKITSSAAKGTRKVAAKPRVAHVVLGLPVGGTERLVEKMLRHPWPGLETSCICLDTLGSIGEGLLRDGIPLEALGRRPGLDWSLPSRIAAAARRQGARILHCHQYTPWFYGVLARAFAPELRVIFTEHGRFQPDLPSSKRRIFNRILHRFTHAITAVSPAVKEALIRVEAFPPEKIAVLFNGVEEPKPPLAGTLDKNALRDALGLQRDRIWFVLIARMDPIKWTEGLIDAFARVQAERQDIGLALVGDGPCRAAIEADVRARGLTDHVVLPGFREDVTDWLRASDVFVLPSLSEGTSISLIEAMAIGLPAIASRVGGNPYVLTEGETGLLFPTQNAAELAVCMRRLTADAGLRGELGAGARKRYEEVFRLERMFKGFSELYGSVMKAGEENSNNSIKTSARLQSDAQ